MYSDIALHIAIKFNELPAEKQILIMQSILIIAEVLLKQIKQDQAKLLILY